MEARLQALRRTPLSLPLPWLGAAAVALALVLLLLATRAGLDVAAYWAIGLAFGVILQRSRLCFAGAFRDLVLSNDGRLMRAIIAGLVVATLGFSLLMARFVPDPSFGSLPPGAHVLPVGFSTIVGGVLFGIGMVLAGGCISGTLWRMGEGYLNSWVAMLGILVGLSAAAHTWGWWWQNDIQYRSAVWLPARLGHGGAVALVVAALAGSYLAILWWETRSPRLASAPPRKVTPPALGVRAQLRQGWNAVFGGNGWPYLVGGVALAVLNLFSYAFQHPLGVTGELSTWANRGTGLFGASVGPLIGTDRFSGCNLVAGGSWLTASTTLDAGLVFGAFTAAVLAREFKLRWSRRKSRYPQLLVGGSLMGYGAGLALGCTIGAFFSSVPSLALSGWVFAMGLLGGAFVGVQIIRRLA